ncbi:putative ccch zinc finger dna binding protein [Neofusicoccum parvum UCRNP2]|uniref:Putative ccch zinc finger dna binding protein n=1 Tax=Botryosphaeria parva (strain UCR-NP2) TaxID=1287680 RepID=R1GJR1_BOTPV|nr:putative ccch zinc finger dna binding protein [Neofusicoccum parvum UCRNP2]
MLNEPDLETLEDELKDYQLSERATHDKLQRLLQKHENLLKDYRQLRSDFEEEKESREKYKKIAKAQERNPFVLVLIDGDGYVFKDELLSTGATGGIEAAQLLNDKIQEYLRRLSLDDCRIMVRIYCNLAGLSKTLARAKIVGFEARSLAPFTASFTRSRDLYDFVDAGDKKEGADFKIRGMRARLSN